MQKCPSCHTWNENRDYCSNCNHLLNYEIARKLEIEKKEVQEANREKDAIDNLIHRMKNSRFILKGIFYFFYSIWFIFAAIVSFFVAIIAAGPG